MGSWLAPQCVHLRARSNNCHIGLIIRSTAKDAIVRLVTFLVSRLCLAIQQGIHCPEWNDTGRSLVCHGCFCRPTESAKLPA